MLSVIIVDQDLVEAVKGYGKVLDGVSSSSEVSQLFNKHFNAAQLGISDKTGLKNAVYEATKSDTLGSLSDKEFEPTVNLALHVLSELYGSVEALLEQQPEFLSIIVASAPVEHPLLRDRKLIKLATILLVLTNVFNLLPESLSSRVSVLVSILLVLKRLELEFSLVLHLIGDNLVLWLQKAKALEAQTKEIFWGFVGVDVAASLSTLELVKSFIRQYSVDTVEQAEQLSEIALRSTEVDVSFLVSQSVASALAEFLNKSDLVRAFQRYTKGEIVSDAPAPLNQATVLAKLKILALCKFFSASNKTEYAYGDIPLEFASGPVELETLLVNAIKSGVIEGKLNQINESFYLTRTNHVIHAGADTSSAWAAVEEALGQWKALLHNIHEVVNTARDNIVNTRG